ncbi:MAG: cation-translocating P-type ATPase [Thermoplasmatota archaeon]
MPAETGTDADYHKMTVEEVLKQLGTTSEGLSSDESSKRLESDGPNEIPKVRQHFFRRVAPQIFDFVILLLLGIAAVLAFLAFLFPDNESTSFETSIAIVFVIIISWGLIVFQMYSAERSLEALRRIAAARASVKREGKWVEVPTSGIVKGDIVRLGEGVRVPADVRMITTDHLTVDESSLTGESVGVEKTNAPVQVGEPSLHQMSNMAFMSTVVTRGAGEGVVVHVALETELGKIAKRIEEAPEPEIPLQRKMSQLARTLSLIMFILIFTLMAVQFLRLWMNDDLGTDSVMEQLVNAVILGVVAVPWSFPIITTSVMARGMTYLVRENAIVRRVASIEGLGRVCVICSDKTGTMTQNAMTVKTLFHDGRFFGVTGSGYGPEGRIEQDEKEIVAAREGYLHKMIAAGYLNNDAKVVKDEEGWKVLGDPTEGALRTLGNKAVLDDDTISVEAVREVPFDSDRKMMTKLFDIDGKLTAYSKGGFEAVIRRCDRIIWNDEVVELDRGLMDIVTRANALVNGKAQRTLAIAYHVLEGIDPGDREAVRKLSDREIESSLILLGFVGMIDPPKEGVREAVQKCHEAGIRVVMITGDSKGTASAIARDLGVLQGEEVVLEGSELPVQDGRLRDVSVFCRVSPEQKVDIVKAYKESGQIIAMTGDGMNDAAALKNADVGVAMGISGVDVAKEASQIILSDDNFATLVTAVHRGRQIFDNIRKSITYQIYTNISELSVMFLGSLIFVEQLMGDKHLLFLYFSTHLFPVAALVLDKTTPGVMREPPRAASEGIVSSKVLGELGVMIATMTAIALGMYLVMDRGIIDIGLEGDKLATIQTMTLTFMVWGECFNLFNSLSMKDSLIVQLREKSMLLPVLMALVPVSALTFLMYYGDIGDGLDLVGLSPVQYAVSVFLGLLIVPVLEAYKIYVRRSAGKDTRISRFFRKGRDIGVAGYQRLNELPSTFQRELARYTGGMGKSGPLMRTGGAVKRSIGDSAVGKGISRVGSGLKSAALYVPEKLIGNIDGARKREK